ncbi:hypothetical protein F5B20DRAFT_575676 [Whalleya microplaca]|nr:hypothetical protein F5B20DRAFT_575676 [Whalleya microplaca]
MLRAYSSLFRSNVRSALEPMLRHGTAGLESQVGRRTFASRSPLRAPRLTHYATPRPTISTLVTKNKKSPLRATHRSFHKTSRSRGAKPSKNATPQEPQGLTARLKKLSREYGWAAVGVYLGLSVLDFPLCFLLVRVVGTERIGEFEHFLVSNIKRLIPQSVQDFWHEYRAALKRAEREQLGNDEISEHVEMAGWGVEEAEARHKAEASLGTQLALAYAIHKSFIFIRVPLTAAVTPKVVKVLRSWGWNIGKRSTKR